MAQHDYVISNGSGSSVRSDLNNALAAIVSQNSGASEPTTTYAYQFWADTTAGVLKMRNGANNAWITLRELDGTLTIEAGSASAPGLYFAGDANTGIYSPGANQFGIATNGDERVKFGTNEVVFNDNGSNYDFRIEGDADANLFFVDASTDRVRIGTIDAWTDRVGIGTTNSARRLHVAVAGSDPQLRLQDTSASESIWSGIEFIGDSARQAFIGKAGSTDLLIINDNASGALRFSVNSAEAMRINSDGELLVGYTSDNGAYKLQVNSQIFATSATIATSDGRYKENVATLGGCLDLVKALRPVSFTWKPQQDIICDGKLVREGHNFPDGTQVGFIAQEVQEVLAGKPWLGSVIKENTRPAISDDAGNELAPEEQFFGIAEGNLIAVLTNALQEAITRIETLDARVAALETT